MKCRSCVYCNKAFRPKSPHHIFCSTSHRDLYNKGKSWEAYFKSLLKNNGKERKELSTETLLQLYKKQKGLCALSGVTLTRVVGKGQVSTNASIDRVKPGGPYTKSNIRLVCSFVNSFRGNLLDAELLWWARKIVSYNE